MSLVAAEVERRVSLFADTLRIAGFRVTQQRLEIAREVAASDLHPDVEEVYREVRKRLPSVSLDTVYRALAEFERLGLVSRVNACPGPTRYEANQSLHHHFVCRECGLVRDVHGGDLDLVSSPTQVGTLGRVERVEVSFRGLCRECERKEQADE